VLVDQLAVAIEDLHALPRRQSRPGAGAERAAGSRHGGVHVLLVRGRDGRNDFRGRGVHAFETTAVDRIHEASVDEEPRFRPLELACRHLLPVGVITLGYGFDTHWGHLRVPLAAGVACDLRLPTISASTATQPVGVTITGFTSTSSISSLSSWTTAEKSAAWRANASTSQGGRPRRPSSSGRSF